MGLTVFGVIAGLYVLGRVIGSRVGNPTIPGWEYDPHPDGCKAACHQWAVGRARRGNAEKDEAAARARADRLRHQYLTITAAAAGLAVAAAAVATMPTFGQVHAAGLLAIAAALIAYSLVLLGQLSSAEFDVGKKSKAAQAARNAEAEAFGILSRTCSAEERAHCLAMPSPC